MVVSLRLRWWQGHHFLRSDASLNRRRLEGRIAAMKRIFCCWMFVFTLALLQTSSPAVAGVITPLENDREAVERQAVALARYGADLFVQTGQIVALDDVPEDILPLDSLLRQHAGGVFVTYLIDGANRGCYGSLHARHATLAEGILWAAAKAIWDDPSHRPLTSSELNRAKIAVTVVHQVEPVTDPYRIQPLREGLFVQAGMRQAVLLPGEARTARYTVEWVLRKAGIDRPNEARFFTFQGLHFGAKLTPAEL